MPLSPVQIKEKLLKGIDEERKIINPGIVLEAIALLEKTAITRTDLEITRLGAYINDIRKKLKSSDKSISARCKKLIKSWQQLALPASSSNGSPASTGYSPASARLSNTPSHNLSPYLPSQSSSPALLTTYARRTSPTTATRVVSPLVRQPTRNDNGSTNRKHKSAAPASPRNSSYSHSKRISSAETRQPKPTAASPYSPAAVSSQPSLTAKVVNTNKQHRNVTSTEHSALPATAHNNHTHRTGTPNTDATNRVYAGNKKRRRSEDSATSDTSSIKKAKPLINGETKLSERVRTPRVKTTVQLIAELQAQSKTQITSSDTINRIVTNQIEKEEDDINLSIVPASAKPRPRRKNGSLVNPPEAPNDLSKTKSDMVQRFLQFQESLPSPTSLAGEQDTTVEIIDVVTESPKKSKVESITDPYALLPPIDLNAITWSDDDDDIPAGRNPITGEYATDQTPNQVELMLDESKLTKILTENWHGVTGTSSSNRDAFHEWTDTFTINPSDSDKDDVYVLPYVDI